MLLGFGWDEDHPFRPWPRLTQRESLKSRGFHASCCGMFINIRFVRTV
jgi:hypothetical protein